VLAQSVRVLIGFGVVVAVIVHSVATGVMALPLEFFRENTVPITHRQLMIVFTLGAGVVSFVFGAVTLWRDRVCALGALEWLVRLLCPVITAPLLIGLLHHDFGTDVEEALLLGIFVIAFDRLLRVSLDAWSERPYRPMPFAPELPARAWKRVKGAVVWYFESPRLVLLSVVLMAIGHGIFMGTWAVWSHQRFSTFGYDLGQYDQIFANTLHGNWLAVPALGVGWAENWGELNGHADFGTFYMLPIYAIHPRATTLLVMQATMLAGATVPLYLFAKHRLPTAIAFAVALAWLLYSPLHGAQLYDVHMQPFGAAWAICAICAVEYKKWKLYWLFLVLAILCREDVSIGLAVMGLFLAVTGHRVRTGIATVVVASLYFVGLRFFVMKNHGFAVFFKDLIAPGEPMSFGSVIATLVSNPAFVGKSLMGWEKLRYFAQIFAPLAFLPLRRPMLWILCIPGFILTFLTTAYLPTIQISFQYVSNWAYLLPATAVALSLWPDTAEGKRKRNAAAIALLVASIVGSIQWGAYSPRKSIRGGFNEVPFLPPSEVDKKREVDLRELMTKIPEKARLCTSDRIQPHTTYHLNNWSLKDDLYDCEYLLWSTNLGGDLGSDRASTAVATGKYDILEQRPGLMLAKKKAPPAPPPAPAPPAPTEAPH